MKHGIIYWLTLTALLVGCGDETQRIRRPSIEGITLADLQPTTTKPPTPVMLFMVTTYLIAESSLETVRHCYDSLPQDSIRFHDKEAFEANGFLASLGTGMMAGPVADCLIRMGAEQFGHASLILDADQETPFSQWHIDEATVAYIGEQGDPQTLTLRNGTASWMLTARPDPANPRRILTHIEPAFTPHGIMGWPGAERFAQRLSHRFETGRFDVSLREADFIVLGVNRDTVEALTTLERLLFLHPGRQEKVRLYAILCVKTDG